MSKPGAIKEFDKAKVVAENRRARFDYFVEERFEAGIELQGTEVKALRTGEGSIAESYALIEGEEVWLINSHIPQYGAGSWMNHEPRRRRKLLLRGKEIDKLHGAITRQGLTLVPLSIYFNTRGRAKIELALAKGKKAHDKRETIKERDWKREQGRLLRQHGRDLGPVRADPGQLEQVIVNLSVNARDAMMSKGGGALTIQTYAVRADQVADLGSEILPIADYSAVSIADTGTGIPASILSKVFEPFFTTKEVGKGTGLGLSTVYGIVKQSGGFIFADSKVGEGTRFTIYLPVHRVEEEKETGRRAAKKDSEGELWGTGTILLVEDEPMVRTVAERALTRHGYQVLTANNGEEALEIVDRGDEIALLISDVVMPLMDGPTMVREARKTRPDLPILFMSGYAEEQLRKSIDIANVAFLPKPFSVQELAEAARKALTPL